MEIRLRKLVAAVALLLAALLAAATVAPGAGAAANKTPSRAQIRAAIRRAERSGDLWATVNICNTARYPNAVGIRGQMPTLGFRAQLRMVFGIDYWSYAKHAFVPLPHVSNTLTLGRAGTRVHQAGVMFTFSPHAGLLRGRVRYEWRLGKRLIGHVTRLTRNGHSSADYGDPKGFSSWKCDIP